VQAQVLNLLASIRAERDLAVLFISHDLSVIQQVCDFVYVLRHGRMVEKGGVDEVLDHPSHPYTQMLISSLPEVGVRYRDKKLAGIPGSPPSLLDPPTGCRFRARCPLAFSKCVEEPSFVEVDTDHSVACWKVAGADA